MSGAAAGGMAQQYTGQAGAIPERPATTGRSSPFRVISGYNPTIDYIRFACALVIVQFHAKAPLGYFGEAAVGFFCMAMAWFIMLGVRNPKGELKAGLADRTRRLLYPFFVWGAIQILTQGLDAAVHGKNLLTELKGWFPPEGSFAQLWFLPWAVVISIALTLLFWKKDIALSWRSLLPALAGLALASFLCFAVWGSRTLPLILALSVLYLPSVLAGMILFAVRGDGVKLVSAALAICGIGVGLWAKGLPGTQQLIIAAPLMAVALMVPTPKFSWTRSMSGMSMDIYLVHISILAVLSGLGLFSVATHFGGFMACLLSIAAALVMQFPAIGRWLR